MDGAVGEGLVAEATSCPSCAPWVAPHCSWPSSWGGVGKASPVGASV